jgi:hypothetical protein
MWEDVCGTRSDDPRSGRYMYVPSSLSCDQREHLRFNNAGTLLAPSPAAARVAVLAGVSGLFATEKQSRMKVSKSPPGERLEVAICRTDYGKRTVLT